MPYSDWLESQILNFVFRGVAWTPPAVWYVALFTVAPGDAGSGTEVTGGNYSRVAITSNTAAWNAPSAAGLIDTTSPVAFPTPSASWGNIVAVGLMSAATGGNLGPYIAIAPVAINAGATVSFANGALDVTLD